jgi:hypothetical protein
MVGLVFDTVISSQFWDDHIPAALGPQRALKSRPRQGRRRHKVPKMSWKLRTAENEVNLSSAVLCDFGGFWAPNRFIEEMIGCPIRLRTWRPPGVTKAGTAGWVSRPFLNQ